MGVSNDGTTFKILGELMCVDDVIKCGYKNIVVQRSTTLSPTGFSDYATYDDVYANSSYCIFAKSLTVPSGYYYRVCVTFYAREGIFSTQSIDGITNAVYI